MIKILKRLFVFLLLTGPVVSSFSQNGSYKALYASQAPAINGDTNDLVWNNIQTWNTYNQVWLNNAGTTPEPQDFSWKFKLAWDEDRFYILAVITDDVLSDRYDDPTDRYYEDDCFEVFFDEDNSGGPHESSFQAFAYHVSLKYDIVDSDASGTPRLLNDHATVRMDTVNGKYVWEAAFKVYDKSFTIANPGLPVKLSEGKEMGWALAYCDNDGRAQRDHFFGSESVEGTNKNVAYQTADVFATVQLVKPGTGTFSHVMVDNGLMNPTAMQIAPNGDIYITEQTGSLKVIRNGELQSATLVQVQANTDGPSFTERGLLGLAFDPYFTDNNVVYLYYTTAEGYIHNRVSSFTLNGNNNVSNTEKIITELDTLGAAFNHNGGAMHFGPDGKLYIATGENAVPAYAQDLTNTHGKLLRINKDGTIPADNPFVATPGADPRIWSYGLRNPFTFDISSNGKILLNDVGFESWEEIDDATSGGRNFGWPLEEGMVGAATYQKPLYAYNHTTVPGSSDSTGCAVTGGTFFEPSTTNYPQQYIGKYFFMDYCGSWINMIDPETGSGRKTFATQLPLYPIAIDYHPDGNLYYLTRENGSVYKITYSGEPVPVITRQPESVKVNAGSRLELHVMVSGAEPLTFQWTKNGAIVQGVTSNRLIIQGVQPSDSGVYVLSVTNTYGSVFSKPVRVEVADINTAPAVTIRPVADPTFQGGQTYRIKGQANDPEDGMLPASAFTWSVDLHHGSHVHDGLPQSGKDSIDFTVPVAGGHTETNIFYRIKLIARDSGGLSDTAFFDLQPELVDITIQSEPAGFKFTLDGTPVVAPYTFTSVKGVQRRLGPAGRQELQEVSYEFDTWDHTADSVTLIEPVQNKTYTINYKSRVVTGLEPISIRSCKVFPNPFSGELTLDITKAGKITLFDATGTVVLGPKGVLPGLNIFNLPLESGLYQLLFEGGGEQIRLKVVKE